MLYAKNLEQRTSSESDLGVIKKWYDEENHWYIKASSYDKKTKTYHIEAVMEALASQIGLLFGFNVVEYWLEDLTEKDGTITKVCISEDYKFKLNVEDFISAKSYLLPYEDDIQSRSDRYRIIVRNEPQLKTDLDKMILFDYLINNYDRHLRNFELYTLADNSVHLSPYYDNGSSLLADWSEDDLEDLKEEELFDTHIVFAETQCKCFTLDHSTSLRLVSIDSFNGLNLHITKHQLEQVVNQYKKYLSPIRIDMIIQLLEQRLFNIRKYYNRISK